MSEIDWDKRAELEERLDQIMEDHSEEHSQFHRVANKLHQRSDLHAFILLDKIVPGNDDIVAAAEHDEIYLSVKPYELMAAASKDQIIELIRCGVHYDSDSSSLSMFV